MSTTSTATSTIDPTSTTSPNATSIPTAQSPTSKAAQPPRTIRPARPDYNAIHAQPLPITIHPLPAFIPHNPLSLLRIAYIYLSQYLSISFSGTTPSHQPPYKAYYDPYTQSIHVTDPAAVRALWEKGFWGKGSLSRSEPEWRRKWDAAREGEQGGTAAEVTGKRREERRREKMERARREAEELQEVLRREKEIGDVSVVGEVVNGDRQEKVNGDNHTNGTARVEAATARVEVEAATDATKELIEAKPETKTHFGVQHMEEKSSRQTRKPKSTPPSSTPNQEHLQLTPSEAFFLHYGLGVLSVYPSPASTNISTSTKPLTTTELLDTVRRASSFPPIPLTQPLRPDDHFLLNYVVFHHFRSLGWVARPGIKFGVDFLLYYRGPAFSHAEFAVIILPSYAHPYWNEGGGNMTKGREERDWWWLHAANRVQSQVRKSLVLVYVEVPPPEEEDEGGEVDVGKLLKRYSVREFMLKRWTANRNR